jgi:hypothetical protein
VNTIGLKIITVLFLGIISHRSNSQDSALWTSAEQRTVYALDLEKRGKWDWAAREWLQISIQSNDDQFLTRSFTCYRKAKMQDSVLLIAASLKGKEISREMKTEIEKASILAGNYMADSMPDTAFYKVLSLLNNREWREAKEYYYANRNRIGHENDPGFNSLINELKHTHWHRQGVATMLSVALPGAGKLYAGHTQDALSSFAQIVGSAAITYMAYRKWGVSSFWVCFYGAAGVAYYGAGIAGSSRSVKADRIENGIKLQRYAYTYTYTYFLTH